jgi:hypothetical protein
MDKHNVTKLEAKIKELVGGLAQLAATGEGRASSLAPSNDLQELFVIIHRPGWTTIAESIFVEGIVDTMLLHVKALDSLKQALVVGSRAVGAAGKVQA